MRSKKQSGLGTVFVVAVAFACAMAVHAGEKIEITPVSPSSKSSGSPLAPQTPSKLDLELDKLEGARIQTLQPGAPRMTIPSPSSRPSEDRKDRNWLMESVINDKPLDYNRALGVKDYSPKPKQNSARSFDSDFSPFGSTATEGLPGRNDFKGLDSTGRSMSKPSYLDHTSSVIDGLPNSAGSLRSGMGVDSLPNLPPSSNSRDGDQFRSRSALKAEVDSLLSRPESRFSNPMGNGLSVESILRPPGVSAPAPTRPSFSAPVTARPTAAQEALRPAVSPRELSPAAAFAKENEDALSTQRPRVSEPERRKDEPRYRPAVLPLPKRGF